MNSIPAHILLTAEVRFQDTPEDKAAHVKKLCINLPLPTICKELNADYQKTLRRYKALEEGKEWTGVGRPPLINYKDAISIHSMIKQKFRKKDCADYTDIANCLDDKYRKKLEKMAPEDREKYPPNLRKNYKYEASNRLQLNTKCPCTIDKDRYECATTKTIEYFFENTYTEEMCSGVPPQLCFNSDETSVEISKPRKIIIPPGEQEGHKVDKFHFSCHISAMVTINAAGDDFVPYIIVPLKNMPKDLTPLVAGGKIDIGGSDNGWINDECFECWAKKFIERVIEIRKTYHFDQKQKAILFLDGHCSRNNRHVMDIFKKANIEVIIFPPHLTHIMQPFDRVVARPLKDALPRIASHIIDEIDENEQEKISVVRTAEIQGFVDAHRIATTTHNCRIAFEACGLLPRNPEKILKNKNVHVSQKNFIQTDLVPNNAIKISGLCITSDDVRPLLRKKSPGKKSKK